jgi:hypothetical protein
LLTRLRWWLEDLRDTQDAKIVSGLLVLAVLVVGGFFAARTVAHASTTGPTGAAMRIVTMRQKVRVREHGRVVTRWRLRRVRAQAQTVLETQLVHTPEGIRMVTRPVTRYRVVYRKHLVTVQGKARTVLQPVTNTKTFTSTSTQRVTVTDQVTDNQAVTVTKPVTVVATTTVVSTQTETVPLTITVTVPLP